MTIDEVLDALTIRYAPPEWAFIPQVRNGTGWTRPTTRTADAIALNLWPSRGMELHGFEIKAYRGDWLAELKNPEKAEEMFQYCDRWWIVLTDPEIVRLGELPATWGLLIPRGKSLACKVDAPKVEAKEIDRPLLAAILRRVTEIGTPAAKIAAAERKAKREGEEEARKEAQGTYKHLEETIHAFQEKSGVKIESWNAGWIGEAVRAVLDGPMRLRDLRTLRTLADRIVKQIDEELSPEELAEVD